MQYENAINDQSIKILEAANIYDSSISVDEQFANLDIKYIDFENGLILDEYLDFDIESYDQLKSTRDASLSTPVPASAVKQPLRRRFLLISIAISLCPGRISPPAGSAETIASNASSSSLSETAIDDPP